MASPQDALLGRWRVCFFALSFGLFLLLSCSAAEDVCPPISDFETDKSRCCEALKFCCDQLTDKTQAERDAAEECKKFVNGTQASCQSQYYSMLSFNLCQPLKELPKGDEPAPQK